MKLPRFLISTKFALILLLFLTPFVNVSCSGFQAARLSGSQMAFGTTMQVPSPFGGKPVKQEIAPEYAASAAFGIAALGLLVGVVAGRRRISKLNVALGSGGALSLVLLKHRMEIEALTKGKGMLLLDWQLGFWVALLLFLAVVGVAGYQVVQRQEDI